MGVDATGPQTAIMNKLMMYVFPLFVVVGGPFFPLAILFYWLSNNSWTFGQLWVAHRIQDRKRAVEANVVEAAKVETTYTKPAPGARPQNPKRKVVQPSPVNRPDSAAGNSSSSDSSPDGGSGSPGSTGSVGSNGSNGSDVAGAAAAGSSGASGTATRGPTANGTRPSTKSSPGNPRKKKPGRR